MARHGLIDDGPLRVDLALPTGVGAPAFTIPISWRHFSRDTFVLGRSTLGLYSRERSLVDAFRLRRLEGPELGNEARRQWLVRRGSQPSSLLELAAQFPRAAGPLRRSLEVLL